MRALLVCLFTLGVSAAGQAQHLGDRQQWQPPTEHDPRLQQRVSLEILGRAAVTALPILSEKTGVSLSVAPEDLATVGERKFTVIAKDLELKSIMVQLCEALQECHWDVDARAPALTYCLHRNSGADQLLASSSRNQSYREWTEVQARLRLLEAAQRALRMSPEELDELEKTDLIIARTVRFAPLRGIVEGLFSLPPNRIEELLGRGVLLVDYHDAPPPLQEAARLLSRYADVGGACFDQERPEREWPRSFQAFIRYSLEWGGIIFAVLVEDMEPSASGTKASFGAGCGPTPPGYGGGEGHPWGPFLLATGAPDGETADQLLYEWEKRKDLERKQDEQEATERRRAELLDPELQQLITLDEEGDLTFSGLPRAISRETGLSAISDYFTPFPDIVPDQIRQPLPLWRLLDLIGKDSGYQWKKVGQCLVFHHLRWYDMIAREIPEHLIVAYRQKLDQQGQFTLEDVAALAAMMARAPEVSVPGDLREAGLLPSRGILSFLRIPISPRQLAKARSPEGLSLQEMTPAQRQAISAIIESDGQYSLADFENVTLTLQESSDKAGTKVRMALELRRDTESVIADSYSFKLPRREKVAASGAPADEP